MGDKYVKISAYITEESYEYLQERARKNGKTCDDISYLISYYVNYGIEQEKKLYSSYDV